MKVRFIDYVKLRISQVSKGRKLTPFGETLRQIELMMPELEHPCVTTGQDVLNRILFKLRADKAKKAQVSILVNAYRSYCKGGKEKEDVSIRKATAIPYL